MVNNCIMQYVVPHNDATKAITKLSRNSLSLIIIRPTYLLQ